MAERRRARDDAPALAELRRLAARRRTRSPTLLRRVLPARRRRTRSCAGRTSLLADARSTSSAGAAPKFVEAAAPQGRRSASCPSGYDVDTHFTPALRPVGPAPVPRARRRPVRGDRRGHARRSSPTASRPSPRTGIELESGAELEADIIVTATGLNLLALGGMRARRRRRARSSSPRPSATRA